MTIEVPAEVVDATYDRVLNRLASRAKIEGFRPGKAPRALAGVDGNRWYTPPPGVVSGPGNSWYLVDTTKIEKLPGDNPPSPTPSAPVYVVPPDPGGPVLASPSPTPIVCPSPHVPPTPCP